MLNKISERIYYMNHMKETDRPVLGYIKGENYSLMIDEGNSKEHVELFTKEMLATDLKAPDFVAITHMHWDHCFGLHAMKAISIACRMTNDILLEMSNWEWNDKLLKEYVLEDKIPLFCEPHIRLEYPDLSQIIVKPVDITFENEMTLDLGGVTCKLLRIGSTHTPDSIVIYIPEEKVIFMGDAEAPMLVRGTWVDNKETLQSFYDKLEQLYFDIYITGHDDEPLTKDEAMSYIRERL